MRSLNQMDTPILDNAERLPALSIVIDDFDSVKNCNSKSVETPVKDISLHHLPPRPYTRQSSDASIRKILEEAEVRKHEFWKLIDEHNAVIENLKKIEQLETGAVTCKSTLPSVVNT